MTHTKSAATHSRLRYSGALLSAVMPVVIGLHEYDDFWISACNPELPAILLTLILLARLVQIWRNPSALAHGSPESLDAVATFAVRASTFGTLAFIALLSLLAAVALGFMSFAPFKLLLAFSALTAIASLTLLVFEAARGWQARRDVGPDNRALLQAALLWGGWVAAASWAVQIFDPADTFHGLRLRELVVWSALALGVGALILRLDRRSPFPTRAVFATALCGFLAVAVVGAIPLQLIAGERDDRSLYGFLIRLCAVGYSTSKFTTQAAGVAVLLACVPAAARRILITPLPSTSAVSAAPSRPTVAAIAVFVVIGIGLTWTHSPLGFSATHE